METAVRPRVTLATRGRVGFRWLVAGLLISITVAPGAADATPPTAVVEELHAALLGSMKASATVGYEERFARLSPVMGETFDLPFMAEKCLGRSWKTLAPEQRDLWVATFTKFTVANYSGRFTGYTGQSFETLGHEPAAQETMLVRTRLVNPTDEDVDLTYRLRNVKERWRIIDVYLDGTISELAMRRTEYASVLKREGFDELMVLLDGKIAELATTDAKR